MTRIPSLVGGIPNEHDFAPSVLFAILSALSLVPFFYRWQNPNKRSTTLAFGSFIHSFERLATYSVRTSQSHSHAYGERLNIAMVAFQQIAFTAGFCTFGGDCVHFGRAVLVNATLEDPKRGRLDEPRTRWWVRRFSELFSLLYLVPMVPGFMMWHPFFHAEHDQAAADKIQRLRYINNVGGLFLLISFTACLIYARFRLPYIDRKAVNIICAICLINCIGPIYRLSIFHNTTTTLNSLPSSPPLYPPGSLTTTASKATFYALQCLPEMCTLWFIHTANIRSIFNTGPWGDWRGTGTPMLREKGVQVKDDERTLGETDSKEGSLVEKV